MTDTNRKTKKRTIILSSILAFFILLLIILPYGIRYGILYALGEQGVEKAALEDVDFNIFTGTLVIENLDVSGKGNTSLSASHILVDYSWLQMFRKRFYVEELSIDEFNLDVRQLDGNEWVVGGIPIPQGEETPPAEEQEPLDWGFGIEELNINRSRVGLVTSDLDGRLQIDLLSFMKARSWEPGSASSFRFKGMFNDGGFDINAGLMPFADAPGLKGTIDLKGLPLSHFKAFLPPEIESLDADLSIESDLSVEMDVHKGLSLSHKGTVSVNGIKVRSRPFHLENNSVTWRGGFSFVEKGDSAGIGLNGDITLDNLSVMDLEERIAILGLHSLSVEGLTLNTPDDIKIALVRLEELALAKPAASESYTEIEQRPVFKTSDISVQDIVLSEIQRLTIASVIFDGMNAAVLKKKDEKMHMIDDITALLQGEETEEQVEVEEDKPDEASDVVEEAGESEDGFVFRVSEFRIKKGANVRFDDESLEPPFRAHIILDDITLRNIDSIEPEKSLELLADLRMGEYSSIKFNGQIQPFLEKMNSDIKGEITQLDLSQFSPYAIQALGYNVVSGQLNAGIDFRVVSDQIQAENDLLLKKIKIAPTDEDKVESLASKLSISLDLMLDVLRDKNGDVQIKLPVDGDIADPQFDFQDVINKALLFATKQTAFSFLKNAFQPYGTLITVIDIAGKATRIGLDPVFFEPGSTDTASSSEYMDQVVKLMNERPGIQISICGKTVNADKAKLVEIKAASGESAAAESGEQSQAAGTSRSEEAVTDISQEELLNFAKERAAVIRKELVEKHGIDPGRLFICNPEIDEDEEAKPRAELLI